MGGLAIRPFLERGSSMVGLDVKTRKRKDTNKWLYDLHVDGKRYRRSGFSTKKEALIAAQRKADEVSRNYSESNADITFEQYYREWMEHANKEVTAPSMMDWYRISLEVFIDEFGPRKKVKDITRMQYQKMMDNYGLGRSKSSLDKLHSCLSQCLKEAVYDGLLQRDPSYKVKFNFTKKEKREEDKYMKIEEYLSLIEYFRSRREKSYIILFIMAITGARQSEVMRMTYNDLFSRLGVLRIPGTKTDNADRLNEVNRRDQNHIKKALGAHPTHISNHPFNLSMRAVTQAYERARNKFGIDTRKTAYALRHTHASYLISQGVPIEYISKRLGHSSIRRTLDTYTHVLDESREIHGEKVRAIFE